MFQRIYLLVPLLFPGKLKKLLTNSFKFFLLNPSDVFLETMSCNSKPLREMPMTMVSHVTYLDLLLSVYIMIVPTVDSYHGMVSFTSFSILSDLTGSSGSLNFENVDILENLTGSSESGEDGLPIIDPKAKFMILIIIYNFFTSPYMHARRTRFMS